MKAEEYRKIKNEIYKKYPAGIDHMSLRDTDALFKELSGRINMPIHLNSEHVIHLLNIQATKRHLAKYKMKLHILYNIIKKFTRKPRSAENKAYKKKLIFKINNLAKLVEISRENIKISMNSTNNHLIRDAQAIKKNISS